MFKRRHKLIANYENLRIESILMSNFIYENYWRAMGETVWNKAVIALLQSHSLNSHKNSNLSAKRFIQKIDNFKGGKRSTPETVAAAGVDIESSSDGDGAKFIPLSNFIYHNI